MTFAGSAKPLCVPTRVLGLIYLSKYSPGHMVKVVYKLYQMLPIKESPSFTYHYWHNIFYVSSSCGGIVDSLMD